MDDRPPVQQRLEGTYQRPAPAPAPWQGDHEPTLSDARDILSNCFGYEAFRPGQEQVIDAVLSGRDALAVMPTGAGKSVCYQIPAALFSQRGLTLVVSPLISLMGDQVRGLKEAGIRGSYLNSTLTQGQQREVMRRAREGWYDLMYIAPERLSDPRFVEFARDVHVPLLAIDEAHCVSQWGQDFRPSYRRIAAFSEQLPARPPVIALTATATQRVRADCIELLALNDPLVQVNGFDRPNLHLASFELLPKERSKWLVRYVAEHKDQAGIVYCPSRKSVEATSTMLNEEGFSAVYYHAGLSADQRTAAQEAFVNDNASIIVATNAFGMGIDKPDVRYVVNYGLPLSLEEYYQEAGRAGRDGDESDCILLWSKGDIRTCHYLIDNTEADPNLSRDEQRTVKETRERLLSGMIGYAMSTSCLRKRILSYFGQDVYHLPDCGDCSVCQAEDPYDHLPVTVTQGIDMLEEKYRRQGKELSARKRKEARYHMEDFSRPFRDGEDALELFEQLRVLRKELADENGLAPYMVFPDATLRAMVRLRPKTDDQLLEVPGVGKTKLKRFGKDFLKAIARFDA